MLNDEVWNIPLVIGTLIIVTLALILSAILLKRLKRLKLKHRYSMKISLLESKAIGAQLNPHFIANLLSAIQYVLIRQGEQEANAYFAKFSQFLSQTLQMSNSHSIVLKDEISYLRSYIVLEKFRLNNQLDFVFLVDSDLDLVNYKIPCMLFQPVIENAILHGLWPKKDDRRLNISFEKNKDQLVGVIVDNGIGREAARKKQRDKNKSKSSKIMIERIKACNKMDGNKIDMQIIDLKDNEGALGTKVIMKIPLLKVVSKS